ncbi:MAG: choice-of-anchor tandem repeat GloVer-containing protein [Terriglobales bacterium]
MTFAKSITAMLLLWVSALPCAWTQTYQVLYAFKGGEDGAFPQGVIVDSAGNVYGTASAGGGEGGYYGSVYKISTTGQFMLLHSFGTSEQIPGGSTPFATLARDSSGNLYGTNFYGGTNSSGVVFKLDQNNNYSVLYNFPLAWGSPYGFGPFGSLTLDGQGNLYGAGPGGKNHCNIGSCGMVFKLDPSGNVTVLHAFATGKGIYPNAGLIRDAAGNLYGTTIAGSKGSHGLVYKLDSTGKETVLHYFGKKPDGTNPQFGLVQDAASNFYGTTEEGGLRGCPDAEGPLSCGVVFKVDPRGNETVLYEFTGKADGGNPYGPLAIDSAGNLYGTAGWGSAKSGVIFKVDPAGNETVLYNFAGGAQGVTPQGGLAMDAQGNLYGTTYTGGDMSACNGYGCGVVFKFTP